MKCRCAETPEFISMSIVVTWNVDKGFIQLIYVAHSVVVDWATGIGDYVSGRIGECAEYERFNVEGGAIEDRIDV